MLFTRSDPGLASKVHETNQIIVDKGLTTSIGINRNASGLRAGFVSRTSRINIAKALLTRGSLALAPHRFYQSHLDCVSGAWPDKTYHVKENINHLAPALLDHHPPNSQNGARIGRTQVLSNLGVPCPFFYLSH